MSTVISGTTGVSKVQDDAVNPVTDIASGIPCVSVYANVSTTLTNNAGVAPILMGVKEFDTTNAWNTSTNKFTPQVAGYYHLKAQVDVISSTAQVNRVILDFYKNGSGAVLLGEYHILDGTYVGDIRVHTSGLVYLNGSTDFITVGCSVYGSLGTLTTAATAATKFQAHLIVGA